MSEEADHIVEELYDNAYQRGRAFERKRILDIAKSKAAILEEKVFVEELEEAIKEIQGDY